MKHSWAAFPVHLPAFVLLVTLTVLLLITDVYSSNNNNNHKRRRLHHHHHHNSQRYSNTDDSNRQLANKERELYNYYYSRGKKQNPRIPHSSESSLSISPLSSPSSSSSSSSSSLLSLSSPLSSSISLSSPSSSSQSGLKRSRSSRTLSNRSRKKSNPYSGRRTRSKSSDRGRRRRRLLPSSQSSSSLSSPPSSSSSSSSSSKSSLPSSMPQYRKSYNDNGDQYSSKKRHSRNQDRLSRERGRKLSQKHSLLSHYQRKSSLLPSFSSASSSSSSSSSASSSSSSLPRDRKNKGRHKSKKTSLLGDGRRRQSASSPSSPSSSSSSASSSSSPSSSSLPRDRSWERRKPVVRSSRPNIVVIMTDDQDVLLGSLKAMPKLHKLMTRQGVTFNNSFVPTPMCCPSRSTFLTGMYVHNHNVYTNNDNCSSPEWQKRHESRSFVTYVNNTYNTGYFGKYLNEYVGTHTPAGWQRWVGLIKNSRFYNYSVVNERGERIKHEDNYYKDYLTDLVANDSCAFLQDSKKRFPDKPVMMMLSVPAPHGPEDSAPQYQHMFVNNTFHRTPSWNYAPNPDKQWLLQNTYKMIPQHKLFTDLLQRRRLQTLQSVDDLVEKVIQQLSVLGELSNTYIIYTSDHGYHLGQYGLLKGKAMPFDFDTRVPLIMRGPGIRPGTVISNIVSNIDMAPTLIDLAGGSVPDHMDGQSMYRLIKAARDRNNVDSRGFVSTKKPWRDSILLEKGKLTRGVLRRRMRTEEMILFNQVANGGSGGLNFYIPERTHRLAVECSKEENRLPCRPRQKWYCIEDNGRLRRHKCRHLKAANKAGSQIPVQRDAAYGISDGKRCICPPRGKKLSREQRRRQRRLMKKQAERDFQARYSRMKRSVLTRAHTSESMGGGSVGSASVIGAAQMAPGFTGFESMFNRRCRILSNQSVLCDLDIYRKSEAWASHKERIDDMIKEYRQALEDLRDIRRHLISQRPLDGSLGDADGDGVDDDDDDDGDVGFGTEGNGSTPCVCDDDDGGKDLGMMNFGKKRKNKGRLDREERRKMRKKHKKVGHRNTKNCRGMSMQCFTHNNEHWKTPPYWNYGPFCFCSNANNNTFWCVRTINQTHNFLYCEFITTFMSFFDMHTDPFQLKNTVTELNYGVLQQLHEELKKLKDCAGPKDCTLRSSQKNRLPHDPDWPGLVHLRRSSKSSYKYSYKDDHPDDDDDDDEDKENVHDDDVEYDYEELKRGMFSGSFNEADNPPDYE